MQIVFRTCFFDLFLNQPKPIRTTDFKHGVFCFDCEPLAAEHRHGDVRVWLFLLFFIATVELGAREGVGG